MAPSGTGGCGVGGVVIRLVVGCQPTFQQFHAYVYMFYREALLFLLLHHFSPFAILHVSTPKSAVYIEYFK